MTISFEYYASDLAAGCCPNRIYILLFDEQNQAIEEITSSPLLYQFGSYVKASHTDFCLTLQEDTERTKCYRLELDDTPGSEELVMPATPDGQLYTIEYWYHPSDDTNYDRDTDTLREVKCVTWNGTHFVSDKLDALQVNALAQWETHCAASYETSANEIRIVAWLEKNKILQTGCQQCDVVVYNRAGDVVVNDQITTMKNNTFYSWDSPAIELDADEAYFVSVKIKSSDGIDYETGEAIVTWN